MMTGQQEFSCCVHCVDEKSGNTGCFISETRQKPFRAISPLFTSLADLFPWMKDNGYKLDEYVYGQFKPWRVVKAA